MRYLEYYSWMTSWDMSDAPEALQKQIDAPMEFATKWRLSECQEVRCSGIDGSEI